MNGVERQQYIRDRMRREDCGYSTPCWSWTFSKNPQGYGQAVQIRSAKGAMAAHRAAYEAFVGPIPTGLCLDHLCGNRSCCNPEHLEPVTRAENTRRANAQRALNGGYGVPTGPRADTRPASRELAALAKALGEVRKDRKLTLNQIGAVMGRSREMVRQYLDGTAEPGIFAWLRAQEAWPELAEKLNGGGK
jgi:hypothetical protein